MDTNGRYWGKPWSLIDGCTPCSPGCDHCWSAAMTHRFRKDDNGMPFFTHSYGPVFNGKINVHPERLDIPLKRKKPTMYAVWNDLFHEKVTSSFIDDVLDVISACQQHTFLILTKRPQNMESKLYEVTKENPCRILGGGDYLPNIYWGLTVCNQQEADEKIPIFLQVPGKKFLSLEPMLGEIDMMPYLPLNSCRQCKYNKEHSPGCDKRPGICNDFSPLYHGHIGCSVILGGETGPGARPMHPDWVRAVRDQCAVASTPFFFKGWGEWVPKSQGFMTRNKKWGTIDQTGNWFPDTTPWNGHDDDGGEVIIIKVGRKKADRLLDGRTHDDLPWSKNVEGKPGKKERILL